MTEGYAQKLADLENEPAPLVLKDAAPADVLSALEFGIRAIQDVIDAELFPK